MPTTATPITAAPITADPIIADPVAAAPTADPSSTVDVDRCGFFDAPHAHLWEYTNGHLVCAFCDEKRPFTT